jgi:putative acetyltransferase
MSVRLRPYHASDEEACIALWQRAWQVAYPRIAFAKRTEWWRGRWRNDLVPVADIAVLERGDDLTGFVTIDTATGYLDQLVVAPECWGRGLGRRLIDEAKRLSPSGVELHVNQDNARALRLYGACGFAVAGEDVNKHSGAPVFLMRWRPDAVT